MPPEIDELETTTVPQGVETQGDSEGDIWGDLDSAFDLEYEDGEALQVEEEQAEKVAETPPEVAPAQEVQQVAEVPPAVEAPPVAEAQPPTSVEEVPQTQQFAVPDAQQLEGMRQQYQAQLAATYALDEQTAELVETNLPQVLPQLASTLHMRIAESVTQTLGQMLPQLISSQLQYMQVAQKSTEQFFGEWPELNKPEYQNTIVQIAQMYRQLKPQAKPSEFVRDVGIQAWTALGLPVQQLLTRGQQGQAVAQAPQAPQPDLGGYAPATPGAPARSQRLAQQADNWFAQVAEEYLNGED